MREVRGVTTVAILSAIAVAATCAAVFASLRLRALSNERFEAALGRIDEHLGALVEHVRRTVERSTGAADAPRGELVLTLDLDRLLEEVANEACARCAALGAAVEVDGPDGEPRRAYAGDVDDRGVVNATLRAVESRPFGAMTFGWSHGPTSDPDVESPASALVVPVLEDGALTGAVGVYTFAPGAFGSEEARALQALVDEVAPAISNARRFARTEQRTTFDEATGVLNRKGYLEELDREVARCRRTGRPLSLVIVTVGADSTTTGVPRRERGGLWELASLMTDVGRATDVVCRREKREFAFLLPETTATGAGTFLARLRSEVDAQALAFGPMPIGSAGLAEWRSGEAAAALDERARATIAPLPEGASHDLEQNVGLQPARGSGSPQTRFRLGSHSDLCDRLEREVERVRARSVSVAILLVGAADDENRGPDAGFPEVVRRLAGAVDSIGPGGASTYGTDRRELAVVLPGYGADAAAGAFVDLRESVRGRVLEDGPAPPLFAGVTEAAPRDDAEAILGRVRQALWQASQAGAGTVVVASVSESTP